MRDPKRRQRPSATRREFVLLSSLFVAIVAILLAVTWSSLGVLSAVRAYVAGESQYSKAQKGAVIHLLRYAQTQDEKDFQRYEDEIEIPHADARARRALERGGADGEGAEADLRAGRNAPDDLAGMISLFRHAEWVDEMQAAIDQWREADAEVENLDRSALALRAEIRTGSPDAMSVAALVQEIDASNERLTALQGAFSNTLGSGARRIRSLALGAAATISAALLAIAVLSTRRLLHRSRESDELLRAMIDNVQDVIVIMEPDGTLVYTSPALEPVLGYRPRDIAGRNLFAFIHRDDLTNVEAAVLPLANDSVRTARVEFRARHASGSWRTLAGIGGTLSPGASGSRIVVSARDVTDQRLIEAQLLVSQKMDSIGRLAGGVAHDFNNLLTVILSSLEVAREELPPEGDASEAIAAAAEAARHATGLTRQLLSFARRQLAVPRAIDLMSVIRGLESMLRRLIGDDVTLIIEPSREALHVRADPGQIEQILVNLAANARDAMPAGGVLTIALDRVTLEPGFSGLATDAVNIVFVTMEVRDTGEAMTDEVRRHLFEPFFTTKEASKGTGLGLAICYGIVRQSGGWIEVESERGKGTCFRIHLPWVATTEQALHASVERVGDDRGTETVLVAEDEPAVRRIAVRALRERGYRVLEASDGEEAIQLASREAVIHLLVTDVTMPRMGGRELATHLRSERVALPVLFMSGIVDEVTHRDISTLDLQFLQKPFTPAALASKVREILDADGGRKTAGRS